MCVCARAWTYSAGEERLEADAPRILHALQPLSQQLHRHPPLPHHKGPVRLLSLRVQRHPWPPSNLSQFGLGHPSWLAVSERQGTRPGSISTRLRAMRRPMRSAAAAPMPSSAMHMAELLRQYASACKGQTVGKSAHA